MIVKILGKMSFEETLPIILLTSNYDFKLK